MKELIAAAQILIKCETHERWVGNTKYLKALYFIFTLFFLLIRPFSHISKREHFKEKYYIFSFFT